MKKIGILIALFFAATVAFAQNNGNGNSPINIASVRVSEGIGESEILEVKITRPSVVTITSMQLDVPGSRYAIPPMTKTSTEYTNAPGNSGNNANDTWELTFDLDLLADENGDITMNLLAGPCCYIPGALQIRSKGRPK